MMGGEDFNPTREDKEFLNKFDRQGEQLLDQNESSYEFYLTVMREHYSADMIEKIKEALLKGGNKPDFERAMRDFLKEIGETEE